jgi:hypothetical protein
MKIEQVLNAKTHAYALTQGQTDRTTSAHTRTFTRRHTERLKCMHTIAQEPCLHSRHDESNLP